MFSFAFILIVIYSTFGTLKLAVLEMVTQVNLKETRAKIKEKCESHR